MKIKHLSILLLACCVGSACEKQSQQCLAVPMALQILSANVRIVDKTTGADLFLSPTSPYKPSDLTVTSSVTGSNVILWVDSAQTDKRFVVINGHETQTFYLKLATLPADTIRMNVLDTQGRCYTTQSVSSITLNGKAVCAPCSFSDLITISKLIGGSGVRNSFLSFFFNGLPGIVAFTPEPRRRVRLVRPGSFSINSCITPLNCRGGCYFCLDTKVTKKSSQQECFFAHEAIHAQSRKNLGLQSFCAAAHPLCHASAKSCYALPTAPPCRFFLLSPEAVLLTKDAFWFTQ